MSTAFISSLLRPPPIGPGNFGDPSYWDVTLTQNDYFGGTFDGWCINPQLSLSPGNTGFVNLYSAYTAASGYTTPNTGLPASIFSGSSLGVAGAADRLDNVNWLVNQKFTADPNSGYSWSEVQKALWSILGFDADTGLVPAETQIADVQNLINLSLAQGEGFVPGADDIMAVILQPQFNFGTTGTPAQPVIIETRFAKLGDFVWHDLDADGIQDANEPGIGAAKVTLNGTDAFGGTVVNRDTFTAADGSYLFDRLVPGDYTVTFTLPNGYTFTTQLNPGNADGVANDSDANPVTGITSTVKLSSGEVERDVDAGMYRTAALGDRVWIDTNSNGQQDPGESGRPGVTVELYKCVNNAPSGPVLDTRVTDANGNYAFTGLIPGDYIVKFITPNGYTLTTANVGADDTDSDAGAGGLTGCYNLESGETDNTVDAGLVPVPVLASLGDRVWFDADRDGQQDVGEVGVAGITTALYTPGADGAFNTADDVFQASQLTNAQGNYLFTGLAAGKYQVRFSGIAPYAFTVANVGNDATDSDAIVSTGRTGSYTLAAGQQNLTVDAGLILASLGDRVWFDADRDGQQDAGEVGVSGVTVALYTAGADGVFNTADDVFQASQITNAQGNYLFTGLSAGKYQVRFSDVGPYAFTVANTGADATDSDAIVSTGRTGAVTLAAGQQNLTVDAGLILASLGDRVWFDADADGQQDAGEVGVAGVTVALYTPGADGVFNTADDVFKSSQVTNAQGNYLFTDLVAGKYQVRFSDIGPFGFTIANTGNDATDSDASPSTGRTGSYTLAAGQQNLTVDAGLVLARLGDRVWLDADRDGQQDAGEVGVAGVTVSLYTPGADGAFNTADDVFQASQVTNAQGNYLFTGLEAGKYQVRFSDIGASYAFTSANVGADATDSDADVATGRTGSNTLNAGQTNLTVDAGLVLNATVCLGDRVWLDLNANGQQDTGEVGINGVTVTLYTGADGNGNGILDTLVTSMVTGDNPDTAAVETGYYKFCDLTQGSQYQVVFTNPDTSGGDRYYFSPANQGNDTTDSDAVPNAGHMLGISQVVTLSADNFTIDAGLYRNGSIHPFVYLDKDGDGTQDPGEGAFPVDPGKTFVLKDTAGNVVFTGKTDVNGEVHIEGLTPGTYKLSELVPNGYVYTGTQNIERTFTITSGEELVYKDGVANVGGADERYETNLGVELTWGNTQLASLGNYVWHDLNANGVQDDGATGIFNVPVTLIGGGNDKIIGTADDTTTGTFTDATGFYKFNGLTPGVQYQVVFTNPDTVGMDAYHFSPQDVGGNTLASDAIDSDANVLTGASQIVTLTSGEYNDTIDAGLYRNGSIHPFVYLDKDGDGTQDPGEGAFPVDPGKTFVLKDAAGNVVFTGKTDINGEVHIEGLTPGTYKLSELVPNGYVYTGTQSIERTFTITSGEELVYKDGVANVGGADERYETNLGIELTWGNTQLASLGDFVWEDDDADGIQDADEAGINGLLVRLLADPEGDGTFAAVKQTFTGDDPNTAGTQLGYYEFTGLAPGVDYQVRFFNPDAIGDDAWIFSPANQGANDNADSDAISNAAGTFGTSATVVLSSGEHNPTIDAGLYRKGSIHVFGFLDIDGDGILDAGEGAFADDPGKTFVLKDADGNVVDTQTTVSGQANFTSLTPGNYTITESPIPSGYVLTSAVNTRSFTVTSGEELVYDDGAAGIPPGDTRTENNLGQLLMWGNAVPPAIDIEKFTNGEDADTATGPVIKVGDIATFIYEVRTAGTEALKDIVVVDDNGTPAVPGDDFSPAPILGGFVQDLVGFGTIRFSALSGSQSGGLGFDLEFASLGFDENDIQSVTWSLDPTNFLITDLNLVLQADTNEFFVDSPSSRKGLTVTETGPGLLAANGFNASYFLTDDGLPVASSSTYFGFSFATPAGAGFNIGDSNQDNRLDPGETWLYQGSRVVTAGQYTNDSVVTGKGAFTGIGVTDDDPSNHFGQEPAALGNFVWEDVDGDGVQDADELDNGINGLLVKLYGDEDDDGDLDLLRTQLTHDDPVGGLPGFYKFGDLEPGVEYQVGFTKPVGAVFTGPNQGANDAVDSDADSGTGRSHVVTLTPGQYDPTVDAGLYFPAAIGDKVWLDQDQDGRQDAGEPGVSGITVELYACVSNAASGPVLATAVTDLNGNYSFTNLKPGDYIVRFVSGAFVLTTQNVGANAFDATDSDADVLTGFTGCYKLESGETDDTVDAGVLPAAIGDKVFEDKDGDGQQDPGEPGIPGAVVKLYTCVGGVPGVQVGQTTTDANGIYGFTGLMPGEYIVEFITPNGYTQTKANVGDDGTDSDAGLGGLTGCYTLSSGETDNTVDAGFYKPAAIGDRVWLDADADGQQDAGEVGVPNVRVELYVCVNDLPSGPMLAFQDTNASGNYNFTGLTPGEYIVKFITPDGFTLTSANVGPDDTDSDAGAGGLTGCYNLVSGETDNSVDAGLVPVILEPGIEIVKDVVGTTIVAPNTPVTFTYSVTNTGGVPLSNIVVQDDNATPDFAADDFNPTPVLGVGGKNIGDLDGDNQLDTTEIWKYSATVIPPFDMTVTVTPGATPIASGSLSYLTLANGDVRVFYRQDANFNDNTYGTGSDAGWTDQGKTHTFSNLTGSDKAGFLVKYADGSTLVQFYQDYLSAGGTNTEGYSAWSGYQSLGLSGDGDPVSGNTAVLKNFDSTLEFNLNQSGIANNGVAYNAMFTNSPTQGVNNPLPTDPKWDAVNGYYFTIDKSAFTTKAFGGVEIFDQHNSPAKVGGSNTYVPEIECKASVNTATVTGTDGPVIVTDDDDATVILVCGPLGSLGDRVWFDTDADGVQDAGEVGITGVSMLLTADFNGDGNDDYTATTTTGANGLYTFTDLPAGTYTVAVDPASLGGTYAQTYDLDGLATPNTATATLTSGQHRTDVDFGYVGSTPGFSVDKTASTDNAAPGEAVTYTYLVKNTGAQPLTNVVVKDDNGTPNLSSDDFSPTRLADISGNNDNILNVGETWKYSATVIPPTTLIATVNGNTFVAGTLIYNKLANNDIRVTYLQSQGVNDNVYGTTASLPNSGWPSGHTFGNLTGSDKLGVELMDGNGNVAMKFYQDYITSSSTNIDGYTSYSGYQSLGVTGGDGSISIGSAANLYNFDSSLEVNLNRPGYTTTIVNSPVNDPNWDAVMGYSFTVKAGAFGSAGFGGANIFDQHNSPSKLGVNSFTTTPGTGEVTNTAVVSAKLNGATVVTTDDATVIVGPVIAPSKFFVVDSGTDKTYEYAANGALSGSIGINNGDSRGITGLADGSKLWILDKDKLVGMYEPDGTFLGSWKADGLGKEPEGISLDGQDMWMVDRSAKKVFWYDNAALNVNGAVDTPERTFTLPAALDKAKGITTDGTKLWVIEDDTVDTVYRFTIVRNGSGTPTSLSLDGTWTTAKPIENPTGLTIDPTGANPNSIWIVDNKTDSVYEFANGRNLTTGSGLLADASFKLGSGNTTPQDIFDPFVGSQFEAMGPALAQFDGALPSTTGPQVGPLPTMADLLGSETLDHALGGSASLAWNLGAEDSVAAGSDMEMLRRMAENTRDAMNQHLMAP